MRFLLSICSSFLRNHAYWPQKKKRPVSFQQKSIPGQLWKPCHSNGIDELINFGETESVSPCGAFWSANSAFLITQPLRVGFAQAIQTAPG